jgi:CMP-2-keto-3-deoxyoctulosonic acid synthetase
MTSKGIGSFSYWDETLKKRVYQEPTIFELKEWFEQLKPVDKPSK